MPLNTFSTHQKILCLLISSTVLMSACSKMPRLDSVLPDTRSEYKKSRSLPDLEVPPDLTLDQEDDVMDIPGEEPTTLSAYQRRKAQQDNNLITLEEQYPGEKVLGVKGTTTDIWPTLSQFFLDEGYVLDLNDAELGVLETDWKQSKDERERFKIFGEPDEYGNTLLIISSDRMERIAVGTGEDDWLEQESSENSERELVAKIKTLFGGGLDEEALAESASSTLPKRPAKARAEIVSLSDDKVYLSIPEEFTSAWSKMDDLIANSGMTIEEKDQTRGIYKVLYIQRESQKEKKGLLKKLKFWGDDEPEAVLYQLSLTGVGNKTELVVLNDKGDWLAGTEASSILNNLELEYNLLR